jgi:hypothetical protein
VSWRGSERGIAREQWRAERLGEGDVRRVVGRQGPAQLPNSSGKRAVGIARQRQVEKILDGFGRPWRAEDSAPL